MGSAGDNLSDDRVDGTGGPPAPRQSSAPRQPATGDTGRNGVEFSETVDLPDSSGAMSAATHHTAGEADDADSARSQASTGTDGDRQSFGRYRVVRVLGQGAFGTVYLGLDEQLDRQVAIKAPRVKVASDREQQEFLTEARQLAKLNHPCIVSVHDVGIDQSQCYIVSGFLEGQSLDKWLKENRPTWQQAVRIVVSLAEALGHAHAQRVVHRDLKLANVIMTDGLTPVIVDFGLALSDSQLTGDHLGVVAGTPSYMAPEQTRGEGHRIDGRTDIYSLGVILYLLLTRQLPFQAGNMNELFRQIQEDDPQPLRQLVPSLPKELERVCLKAMAKSVRHRYTTASDMAEALRQLLLAPLETSPIAAAPPTSLRATVNYVPSDGPDEGGDATRKPYDAVASRAPASKPGAVSRKPIDAADAVTSDSSESIPSASPRDGRSRAVSRSFGRTCPGDDGDSSISSRPDSVSDSFGSRSSSQRSREAIRRRITLVSCGCDVFTSEEIAEALDIEEQQEVLIEFQELVRQVAHGCGGTVFQTTTDGLLICFGFPLALEDASRRGVDCGWQVLGRMGDFNRRLKKRYRVQTKAHAVVHCDQAIVQDRGEKDGGLSIVGQVLNVVNQLEAVAEPDAVIITDDTHKLVRNLFDCESLGLQRLRGLGQITLFQIRGRRSTPLDNQKSSRTPLIGRNLEVGLLQERWEQASEGMGQVVLLIGEAGLGKSRLVQMLKEHVEESAEPPPAGSFGGFSSSSAEPSIVEWRSSPQHQSSSLNPVIDYFERLCGFERDDSSDRRLDKLASRLGQLNFDSDQQVALLAAMLSIPCEDRFAPLNLDPQRQKERTFELLGEWLRELSYVSSVLFIIEDLHWVDPTTLEFLEGFVAQGFNDSILTLLTFRPEFVTPWQSMAHQTQIALNRLTRRQIAEMVLARAGREDIPQPIIDQIIDRTDGVPLFVEEFTQMVVESGATEADPDSSVSGSTSGRSSLSGTSRSREIPATLQDLLMARLDRIDANIEVAQFGAAIGREFPLDLIVAASPFADEELQRELDKLVSADILQSRGRGPRTRYAFKHALIQDAAYGSLIKQKRQQFHQRIGEAIEATDPDIVATQPEVLALHFTEAGESEKAIDYWDKAGTRSLARRAHKEAIEHLRRGLELLTNEPESPERFRREIAMHTALGVPLQATIGYSAPEVEQTYSRAHELCGRLGLTTEQFPVLYGMFRYFMLQAKYPKSRELGAQLLTIAEETQTPHYIIAANRARGGPPVYEGRHAEAVPFLERVISIEPTPELRAAVDRYDVVDPWIAARSYLSWATWLQGYPDQSLEHSNAAVSIAAGLDHSFSAALAISFSQWVHQFRRDVAMTRSTAEKALAISREHGFAFWYGWCEVMLGWAIAQQGRHDEAIAQIRQGIVDWRAQGSELGSHYYYAMLAEACVLGGRYEDAQTALDDAAKFAAETGEGFYAPEIPRIRGRLLLKQDPAAASQAESLYHESIELAQQQGARSLELRSVRSLARLFKSQGRLIDARNVLAPLLDWFTEGLDTYDLQNSRKLLASLD